MKCEFVFFAGTRSRQTALFHQSSNTASDTKTYLIEAAVAATRPFTVTAAEKKKRARERFTQVVRQTPPCCDIHITHFYGTYSTILHAILNTLHFSLSSRCLVTWRCDSLGKYGLLRCGQFTALTVVSSHATLSAWTRTVFIGILRLGLRCAFPVMLLPVAVLFCLTLSEPFSRVTDGWPIARKPRGTHGASNHSQSASAAWVACHELNVQLEIGLRSDQRCQR